MVEIINRDEVSVHLDVAATVDAILRGTNASAEHRIRHDNGEITIDREEGDRRDPTFGARVAGHGHTNGHKRHGGDQTLGQQFQEARNRRIEIEAPPEIEAEITELRRDERMPSSAPPLPRGRGTDAKPLRIFPFGVSRNRLEQAIIQLRSPAIIVRRHA